MSLVLATVEFDLFASLGLVVVFGLWVVALVHAGMHEKWNWVAVILFVPFAAPVYGFVAVKEALANRQLRDPQRRREHRYQLLRQEAAELERKVELQRKLHQIGSRSPRADG